MFLLLSEPDKSGLPRVMTHVEVSTVSSHFLFRRNSDITKLKNKIMETVKIAGAWLLQGAGICISYMSIY